MVVIKSNEAPPDAVKMDEMEASRYAWDIVFNWNSLSESWALHYGPAFLGGVNAVSGLIINSHYRRKLNLASYGYLSSVIPITIMPALLTTLFHRHFISTDMLLMKSKACPICYEVRSAGIQAGMGVAYPMLLGPFTALMLANRYSTSRIPDILEGPKVLFNFVRKLTRPFNSTVLFLGVFQLVASSVITYAEMRNNAVIKRRITEIEDKIMADKEMNL